MNEWGTERETFCVSVKKIYSDNDIYDMYVLIYLC